MVVKRFSVFHVVCRMQLRVGPLLGVNILTLKDAFFQGSMSLCSSKMHMNKMLMNTSVVLVQPTSLIGLFPLKREVLSCQDVRIKERTDSKVQNQTISSPESNEAVHIDIRIISVLNGVFFPSLFSVYTTHQMQVFPEGKTWISQHFCIIWCTK